MKSPGKIFIHGLISAPCFSAHTMDQGLLSTLLCGPQKGEPEVGEQRGETEQLLSGGAGATKGPPTFCAGPRCVLPLVPSQSSGSTLLRTMCAPWGRGGARGYRV